MIHLALLLISAYVIFVAAVWAARAMTVLWPVVLIVGVGLALIAGVHLPASWGWPVLGLAYLFMWLKPEKKPAPQPIEHNRDQY